MNSNHMYIMSNKNINSKIVTQCQDHFLFSLHNEIHMNNKNVNK